MIHRFLWNYSQTKIKQKITKIGEYLLMRELHTNVRKLNHQFLWNFKWFINKFWNKKSPKLVKIYWLKNGNIGGKAFTKNSPKSHQNWWESNSFTRSTNFVENEGGLLYVIAIVFNDHYYPHLLMIMLTMNMITILFKVWRES